MESILQDSGLENISTIMNTKLYYSKDVLKSLILGKLHDFKRTDFNTSLL